MAAAKGKTRAATEPFTIGACGDQHLGYAPAGMRHNKTTGWNQRIVDGHIAHQLTMQSMIDHGVKLITDGGDLMHYNKPLPRDVEVANRVDDLRAKAAIPGVGNSGNHDAGGGNDISAAGVMNRPGMGWLAVYPDPQRALGNGIGPLPGLYEVHQAASNPWIPEGIALHMVSHYGLSRTLADQGVNVDPQPIPGMVNLLFCHGVFSADDRLYRVVNPHGEERPVPGDWAVRGWDAMILSHYHTLGAVPGFGDHERGQVWYTGSSLRRGFSDEAGMRGWLKISIHDTGHVTIDPVPIWQRPQYDLDPIHAADLSVADLDDRITANLAQVAFTDDESATLTGDGGAIVRQKIIGATFAQRQGLAALRGRYATLAAAAAHWTGAQFVDNTVITLPDMPATGGGWGLAHRVNDFTADLRDRYPTIADRLTIPDRLRTQVLITAAAWTDQLRPDAKLAEQTDATDDRVPVLAGAGA